MTRNIFIFLGTFVVGALIALFARAAMFAPHAGHEGHPAPGGEYAGMVSNALTPAKNTAAKGSHATPASNSKTAAADPHANHGASAAAPASAANDKPVNTVCAICGMDVDPKVPTLEYQGKKIGFGCKLCPPKFKAEPDRYGPIYLRNEVIKR
jgi:hypothetical protein